MVGCREGDNDSVTALLGSLMASSEQGECSKPSGLNYLLTQIIKFQRPHGSGATKPRGRLGPGITLAGGSSSLNHTRYFWCSRILDRSLRKPASFTVSWEVFNGSLKARPLQCLY